MKVEDKNFNAWKERTPTVYVIQEIAGTREGKPKINIMGAANYGVLSFTSRTFTNYIFSWPVDIQIREGLKNYTSQDYLLLTGDPAIMELHVQ